MNASLKYLLWLLTLALAGSGSWLLAARAPDGDAAALLAPARPPAAAFATGIEGNAEAPDARYYFDVTGHTPDEIAELLRRAEELHESAAGDQQEVSVAFVLHGPDVDLFARENYARYRDVVDLAAKLDAFGVLDFKACARTAQRRGLGDAAFPDFIELVPYAPDYIEELEADGYVSF
ncbi:MAG: DsrE family protein [Gammaproteobacteria bacterium]|nr:DsrE family protein [Gammaproteobacteria bacterium]